MSIRVDVYERVAGRYPIFLPNRGHSRLAVYPLGWRDRQPARWPKRPMGWILYSRLGSLPHMASPICFRVWGKFQLRVHFLTSVWHIIANFVDPRTRGCRNLHSRSGGLEGSCDFASSTLLGLGRQLYTTWWSDRFEDGDHHRSRRKEKISP